GGGPVDGRRRRDWAGPTPGEMEDGRVAVLARDWRVAMRRSRRWSTGRGRTVDLRRVVRRNMRYGGELFDLPRRQRKEKMRPIVLICDISGSMETYSR